VSVWDQFFAGFITGAVIVSVAKFAKRVLKALALALIN
jgi:hypothetical protein